VDVCLDPACVGFDTPLDELVDVARTAGFPAVEIPITWARHYAEAHGRAAVRQLLSSPPPAPAQFTCALGVPGNVCVPGDLLSERVGDLPGHAALARYAGLTRASVFCDMTRHEGVELGLDELVARIVTIAGTLAPFGVALSVGLIGRDLLEQAGEIWRRVGHPGVGLLVDTVSLAKAELGTGWVESLPSGSIGWLRLADVPGRKPAASLEYTDRLLPGTGVLPLTEMVRACRRRGYRGPTSVEVGDPGLAGLPRPERARRAYEAVRAVVPAD
jgi:sugar phosphate isomerase/epimerase